MSGTGDYISREALPTELSADGMSDTAVAFACGYKTCLDEIALIPAANVRPVLRGKWIDHQEGRWVYAKCSECETVHDVRSNFCPNCGADMREES